MLSLNARALLLVHAIDLYLDELASDCLSHASLGYGDLDPLPAIEWNPADEPYPVLAIDWHTDGIHEAGGLERRWVSLTAALSDDLGVEQLAEAIATAEVRRHLSEDHGPAK